MRISIRKLGTGLICFASVLLLVACNSSSESEQVDDNYNNESDNGTQTIDNLIEADRQDLEILQVALNENFPLFNVIQRKHDIDLNSQFETIYQNLGTRASATTRNLETQITNLRNRINTIGHFFPVDDVGYTFHMALLHRERDEAEEGVSSIWQHYYDILTSEAAQMRFGGIEIPYDYFENMIMSGNVTTRIIEENRIGYIRIQEMWIGNLEHDQNIINDFLSQELGLEHLIIDLRDNWGGTAAYFVDLIIAPLISEPIRGTYYEFLTGGSESLRLAQMTLNGVHVESYDYAGWMSASEFMSANYMPYFNLDDLENLQYVLPRNFIIRPSDNNINFNGHVWILINGNTFSGAATSAMLAKYSGFATLVGSPTGSVFSGMSSLIPLPNTGSVVRFDVGYVTNAYGRQLQELGVAPHYAHVGGDALETVLSMIESGR